MPLKNIVIMRKYAHILASLLLLSLLLSGVLISTASATGWYDASYPYRQTINLTGNTSGAQIDYQLLLNVTYNSHMQSDFDDLRFTGADGTTLIDAWLKEKTDGTSADVWVEFLFTPADGVEETRGYMYYGKADAVDYWDGIATFEFFDDFEDGAIPSNYGQYHSGAISNDNTVSYEGSHSLKGNYDILRGLGATYSSGIVEYMTKADTALSSYAYYGSGIGSGWDNTIASASGVSIGTTWVKVKFWWSGTTGEIIVDGSSYTLNPSQDVGQFMFPYVDDANWMWWDQVFFRKYAANPPTYGFGSEEAFTYPPTPTSLANTTGNFWVNHTWVAGSGNVTDSYNVSVNSVWHNGTDTFYNDTYTAHAWQNITVYAYNNSGALSPTAATQNTQIPNNAITITNTSDWSGNESENVYVDYDATDADSDTPTFSCNQTELFADFDTATGTGNWTTTYTDSGIYYVDFGVSDGYGSTNNYTMTITVAPYPTPSIIDTNYTVTGNDALILFSSTNTLVTFTATSNQTISHWYWTNATYLDGNGTASSNASHYYGVNGTYYVTVRGENVAGTFTDTITWQINVGSIGGGTGGGTANGTYALIGTAIPLGARKTTMASAFVLLSGMFMMMLAKIHKEDEQDVT